MKASSFLSKKIVGALLSALTLVLIGFVTVNQQPELFGLYACNGSLMTIEQVASLRGVTVEMMAKLKQERSLSVGEVCSIPQAKLDRAILKSNNPARPDQPDKAIEQRNLQWQNENGVIPADGYQKAAEHIQQMQAAQQTDGPAAGISSPSWSWIGPGNIGGRIRSMVIHPTNPDIMWAGSVSGGIWKTVNAGASWQIQDDFMANMAVATLAIDPTDPNILYAGTGEGFYNGDGIRGYGVYKTTDGGTTWNQLAATANSGWYYVNRLAISPANHLVLLAASGNTIWKSNDGGESWSISTSSSTRYFDVNFSPDGSRAIASGDYSLASYSTDAGNTWNAAGFINPSGGRRVEVAYAPSAPSIVYASIAAGNGQIWKSTNHGATYTLVSSGTYLGSQGWYDNIIWVDPTDPNKLMVGGIDLWRSSNGGVTLTKISQWYSAPASAHADQHYIIEHPNFNGSSNKTVFYGNDGGVYRTDDYSSALGTSGWTELNNQLGITQFYGGAGSPVNGTVTGGTQDNGTLFYNPETGSENWTTIYGGDGGFSAVDPTDPNYIYGEYVYGQVHRNSTGGAAQSVYIDAGISDAGVSGNFIAPFILDPNDSNRMYVGLASLWRTSNVKAPAGPSWTAIKSSTGSPISAIAALDGDPNTVWVGHNNGDIYQTTNGLAATPTWVKLDNGPNPLPNRYVTRITPDKVNAGRVYVTFGGFSADNIWYTADSGATWADRTGSGLTGLPDAPVRSLVIHPDYPAWVYAGTEVGIFASEDAGATWQLPHDGPTNTSVDELFWVNYTLMAATHGRGMYKIAVISPDTVIAPEINLKGNNVSIVDGDTTPSLTDYTDFGTAYAGTASIDRIFSIQNTGEETLNLTGTPIISISGADAAAFTVTVDASASVAANASTNFTVHFAPDSIKAYTATISIANDDNNENPYNFDIKGSGVPVDYCVSTHSKNEYISKIQLNGGSQTSGAGTNGYQNLSATSFTNLVKGVSYPIQITGVQSSSTYKDYLKIWVDFNHDYDFLDAEEELDMGSFTYTGTHVFSGNLPVPANAVTGPTRMRATLLYNTAPTPCLTGSYGETEDYTITIFSSAPTATRTATLMPSKTPTPTPTLRTFTSYSKHDGWILESSETSNTGGTMNSTSTTFNLGDSNTKKQYRAILSFSTGALPDNAIITAITLKLKKQAIIGGGDPLSIFQGFMVDLKTGLFGSTSALQLTDFQAPASATLGPLSPGIINNTYNINLTGAKASINKWSTNNGLTQIRIRFKLDDDNNALHNFIKLHSGEASAAADRPQLAIRYTLP